MEELSERTRICERALRELVKLPETSSLEEASTARSTDLLDIVLLLVQNYVQAGFLKQACARMHLLLFHTPPPSRLDFDGHFEERSAKEDTTILSALSTEHRCVLALAYAYLLAYHRLPFVPDRAMRFPHHLFLIDWRSLAAENVHEVNHVPCVLEATSDVAQSQFLPEGLSAYTYAGASPRRAPENSVPIRYYAAVRIDAPKWKYS